MMASSSPDQSASISSWTVDAGRRVVRQGRELEQYRVDPVGVVHQHAPERGIPRLDPVEHLLHQHRIKPLPRGGLHVEGGHLWVVLVAGLSAVVGPVVQ